MKLNLLIPLICLNVATSSIAQDLPSDANEILGKLKEFEAEEKAKAERAISEKRKAVASYLEEILERETKNGNLESALAIKTKISELTESPPTEAKDSEPMTTELPKTGRQFERWLATVEFFVDDIVLLYEDDRIYTYKDGVRNAGHKAEIDGTMIRWDWADSVFNVTVMSPTKGTFKSLTTTREVAVRPRTTRER